EAQRAGLKVMLDGQGGDEILAGYRAAYGYRLADLLSEGRVAELGRELGAFFGQHGRSVAAAGTLARQFLPARLEALGRARLKGSASLVHPALPAVPERLRLPRPTPHLSDASPPPRPARAAPLRGPELDGALARVARPVPRSPARRAALLARRRPVDRARPDEGRAARGARRPPPAHGPRSPGQARLRPAGGPLAARKARRTRRRDVRVHVLPSTRLGRRGRRTAPPRAPPGRQGRRRHGALARAEPRALGPRL